MLDGSYTHLGICSNRHAFHGHTLKQYVKENDPNAARNIRKRLDELTGVTMDSLHYSPISCKDSPGGSGRKPQPFNLVSTTVARLLAKRKKYFDLPEDAANFVSTLEYLEHDLVQCGVDVKPVGIYSDGVRVSSDINTDTLYVIYFYFPHLGNDACARPENKHIFTVYRTTASVLRVQAQE